MLGAWYKVPMGCPPPLSHHCLALQPALCCDTLLSGLLSSQFLSHCSQEAGQLFLRGSDLCLQKGRF